MYNKELDFYTPLFVCGINGDGYFSVGSKKLSHEELCEIRDEWMKDENFDSGLCDYLKEKFEE